MHFRSWILSLLVGWTTVSAFSMTAPLRSSSSSIITTSTQSMPLTTLFLSTKEKEAVTSNAKADKDAEQQINDDPNSPKAKMKAMMQPIKDAGVAGAISLFLWEAAFWILSIPTCSILYYQTTGSWPDWSDKADIAKVTGEAVVFANVARFALPLRVGLAISTTPWVQANIVDRFQMDKNEGDNKDE